MTEPKKTLAEIAWEAHGFGTDRMDGGWDALSKDDQQDWQNAANAVLQEADSFTQLKSNFRQLSDADRLAWLNDNFPCCRLCGILDTSCNCELDYKYED